MEHKSTDHILEQHRKVNKILLQLSTTYNRILDSWLYFSCYNGMAILLLRWYLFWFAEEQCWWQGMKCRKVHKPELPSSSFEEAWHSKDKEEVWAKVRIFTRFTSVPINLSSLCTLPWLCTLCSSFSYLH